MHTEHNVWERYRRPTFWANALTYWRNDAVIAVSDAVAASVDSRLLPPGWDGIEVLHHGVQYDELHRGPDARARARRLLGIADDVPLVGTVANLTPKKDQGTLLEAVALLRRQVPDVRLVIAGTGPSELELRRHAVELGVAVDFLGMRDDVPLLLPAFDVFALSSTHEGLSIALLEALGSGVPAVCTRVGGIPEVMTHDAEGLLVPVGDRAALADALERVLAEPARARRYGATALRTAQSFSIRTATERIEAIYDDVLAAP